MIRNVVYGGFLAVLVICAGMMVFGWLDPGGNDHTSPAPGDGAILIAAHDSPGESKEAADYLCDGTADQIEIQHALNALGSAGGTVALAEGTFYLSGNLNVPGNAVLEGQGADATRLEWSAGFMQCRGVQEILLRDFTTTGTGAIFIYNCDRVKVHNVTATVDNSRWGGAFTLWASNDVMEDIEFVNCRAVDCGRMGFMNDGEGSPRLIRDIRYIDCEAVNSGRYSRFSPYGEWTTGFAVAENNDLADAALVGCVAEGSFESGFHIEDAPEVTNLVFENCISRYNGQKSDGFYNPSENTHGLHFGSGYWVQGETTLYGCVSEGNGNAGFSVGPGVSLYNCTDDGSAVGFRLVDTRDTYLEDCTSRNAGAYAVYALEAENIATKNLQMIDPGGVNGNGAFFGTVAHPVVASRFDIVGRSGGDIRTIYGEGCRDIVFTGVIRTDHPEPVVVKRGDGVDTGGLEILAGQEDPGRNCAGGLKCLLLRIITVFL
ncbi:hypothetical protein [Methanoculleus sediminis]|uniref:hypothetical protein n=1 Tax=Methanoculleus sediminis TaxID=1550566 RepID=UPI00069B0112|nr:hypothetical protein [Methanoculleus sediminis]